MKIYRSTSEKRSFRTVADEFISREFVAGQDLEIPEGTAPDMVQYLQTKLFYELKVQVLQNFVLENMITPQQFNEALAPFEGMLQAARERAHPVEASS